MADPKNLKQYVIDGKKYKIDARYTGDSLKNVIAKIRAKNAATAGEPSGYSMAPMKSDTMVPRKLNLYHKAMNKAADILSGGSVKPYPEKRTQAEIEYDQTSPIRAAAEIAPQIASDTLALGSAAVGTGMDVLGIGSDPNVKMGQVDIPFGERFAGSKLRYANHVDVPKKSRDYYKKFGENLAALPGTQQAYGFSQISRGVGKQLAKDAKYFKDPNTVQTIKNIKKNKPTEKIFKEANKEGYVVAPSQTSNPTKMQQRAESAVGQSKMIEAVNIKNQEVTDRLVRKYLGLKEDAPLDALIMDQVRAKHGKVYETIKKLKGKTKTDVKGKGDLFNTKQTKTTVIHRNGDEILEDLGLMQAEERGLWRQYNFGEKAGDRAILNQAKAAGKEIEKIEQELVKLIGYHKQPKLYDKYQKARTDIAKTYTIESAMNPATGMVDARKLGNALGTKKGFMTGEAKKIANFARANPNAAKAPKSRVAKEFELGDIAYSAHELLRLKPIKAAAPIARPLAKRYLLSPQVQNKMINSQGSAMPNKSLLDVKMGPGPENLIMPTSLLELYKDKYK